MPTDYAESTAADIRRALDAQRQAFAEELPVAAATRKARIQRVIDVLVEGHAGLCAAMEEDFGGRSPLFSLANDVLGSIGALKAARDNLDPWLADEPRRSVSPFDQFGARAFVKHQPKGVVGIIGTWNAPLFTLFAPLASVLAAGNRAVLKPSEVAPRTAAAVARAIGAAIAQAEVAVVTGGPDVARAFCSQPWDHLVFTGSAEVGRQVMRAAADNLVPVTLELGGKSPVLIGRSADIGNAAERIAVGKGQNSGQLCVSPDVIWVPEEHSEALIAALHQCYEALYPDAGANPDVVPVVNTRHFERVEGYVAEAIGLGARVEVCGVSPPASQAAGRRLPLRIVVNPSPHSRIATHEIFGPACVLNTYRSLDEAVKIINAGPRPLALYYFGSDAQECNWVLEHTLSGGVSINDVVMHPAVTDAPFGGIGASGMGHYQGREGFLEFSHARTVYEAGGHDPRREWGLLPPYPPTFAQMLRAAVTR